MKNHPASAAAFLAAAVLISACGDNSPLENTTSPEGSTSAISATAGTNLSGFYGNFVTGVPVATVTDKMGHPLAGITVSFEALGGGRLTGSSAMTDSAGRASPTSWRLGPGGAQSVRASISGASPATFTAAASAPPPGVFRIEVRYAAGLAPTATQRAAFDAAATRWSEIILRGGAPYPVHELVTECGDIQGETVDGVIITAELKEIDGAGKQLGSAGPCILRDEDLLPAQGYMKFDTADLESLESRGQLQQVILHEMAHVLGLGTLWDILATAGPAKAYLLRTPPENPVFQGPASQITLFALAGFSGFSGGAVPVENTGSAGTAFAHWRETTFGNELMTGWLNAGANPLSALTIAQFRDLGYVVNDALGEAYSFGPATPPQAQVASSFPLNEAGLTMPLIVINRAGRMVRTMPRIYK